MTLSPLRHVTGFWKPLVDPAELEALARYCRPSERRLPGINAWQVDASPGTYRVEHGGTQFSLFAAVEPIEAVPSGAEVLADVRDSSGSHVSYVLWFPDERSVVVPFDPAAATESFWYELHVPPTRRTALPRSLLSLYYSTLKRLLPVGIKSRLRRVLARRAFAADRFLEWPNDESLDLLQRFLLGLVLRASGRTELRFVWFWPNEHPWAVVLTHDVETASGLSTAPHVAELERERGLRSSFNLVPLDYEIPGSMIEQLRGAGFEIGVHGYTHDGMLFSAWSTFLQRIPTVNECGRRWDAAGFRSPATYRNLSWYHLLGFEYDSSVANTAPFEPQPGGCGSLFPYHVGGLVEMPVTVPQDHTLFSLLGETTAQTWLTQLQQIKSSHGMACVLTHPDPAPGYVGLAENENHYRALLDLVAESEAWTPLPRDLVRWWQRRSVLAAGEDAAVEGGSFGTAVLGPSGRVDIAAPVRRDAGTARVRPPGRRAAVAREPVRVWIDMANSPHVQFFGPLIREIEARGHSVSVTARDFAQTIELLDQAGIEHEAIGHHGGKTTIGKLLAIEARARSLARFARRNRIDVAVHHNSYAQAIAARSAGIPSVTLMDYEHQPANHVSFRLSTLVLVPDSIPSASLSKFGAGWHLRRYTGLKEDFYVSSMLSASEGGQGIDGLDPERPLLVLRPPPDLAVYHHCENLLWAPLLDYLAEQDLAEVLVLPRTSDQALRLSAARRPGVTIADHAITPAVLLRHADGVVTAGGTMAREAAALGIPAYTIFAGRLGGVDSRLISQGRLIEIKSPDDFGSISLAKCTRRNGTNVAREHERVSWLADLVIRAAE